MHFPLLQDLLILLGFSIVVVYALQRLNLPPILGFLITGIIIGPHGLGFVTGSQQVDLIAEVGVILLLFVIGMELSIRNLWIIKNTLLIGGAIQVGFTVLAVALATYQFSEKWSQAFFVGFLVSLSSTAIVLTVLQNNNQLTSPHGRNTLAILIFQDLVIVPMMLLTPILAGKSGNIAQSIAILFIKTGFVIAFALVSGKYLVPRLMHTVAATRSKELFLITNIAICFAIAFLTAEAGLSIALGAFLAGLIISESDYSHQATSIILPFRELFSSFFFISIGMLLDLRFFFSNIGLILLIVFSVFVLKSLVTAVAVAILGYPPRTAILTGLSLFQIGEFAFILSKEGIRNGLLSVDANQFFLAVSIVTMLLTPFVIIFSESLALRMMRLKPLREMDRKFSSIEMPQENANEHLKNHLVIIGFGVNGNNLARASRFANIPYVVIELNAEVVRREKESGVPIIFGDATQDHILELADLSTARVAVIAISDPNATKTIIKQIRSISQSIHLIVRTRYVKEIEELDRLGADDVIPEEFETSIEIFSKTLNNFLVSEDEIDHLIDLTRSDNYELLHAAIDVSRRHKIPTIPKFDISCIRVKSGNLIGKSLFELDLRQNYGINVVGISRGEELLLSVKPEEKIKLDDRIYVIGDPIDIGRLARKFN